MVGQRPQQVLLVPLLVGTDGQNKMSKSLENYIGVDEPPEEMYGKVMSVPDSLLLPYFELLTDVPDAELEEWRQALGAGRANPMELKKRLGREIVAQFHSPQAADEAEAHFERVFQRREAPEEVAEFLVPPDLASQLERDKSKVDLTDFLVAAGLVPSRSEGKRQVSQGAVEVDGRKVGDPREGLALLRDGAVVRVGKRRFARLRFPQGVK